MFIVNTAVPDYSAKIYLPTRIVLNCEEAVEETCGKLHNHGLGMDVSVVEMIPERSKEEQLRAQQLMWLLFLPVGGTA